MRRHPTPAPWPGAGRSAPSPAGTDGRRRHGPRTNGARSPAARFVVAFLGYWCAGLLLIALVPALAGAAVHATVLTFSRLLALLRWPHQVADSVFLLGGAALEIVTDCTPLMPVVAFASAVLAYPARASSRLAACVAGFMILSGFNLARLLVLAVVLERAPWLFEFLHVYLWQTMTLFVVFLLFAGWLRTLAARVDAA